MKKISLLLLSAVLVFGTIFSSFATSNAVSDLSAIHKAEIENQFDQMILSLKNDGKLDIAKSYIDLDGVNGLVTGMSGIDGKGVLDTFVSGIAGITDSVKGIANAIIPGESEGVDQKLIKKVFEPLSFNINDISNIGPNKYKVSITTELPNDEYYVALEDKYKKSGLGIIAFGMGDINPYKKHLEEYYNCHVAIDYTEYARHTENIEIYAERTDKFSFDLSPLFVNSDNVRMNLPVNPKLNACYQDIYTACTLVKFGTLLF